MRRTISGETPAWVAIDRVPVRRTRRHRALGLGNDPGHQVRSDLAGANRTRGILQQRVVDMRDDLRVSWVRQNADRLLLSLAGITVFVVAVGIRDQEGLAIVVAVLGVALTILGVLLPRVRTFSVGSSGIEARFGDIERKVDTLPIRTALANLVARGDQVANALLVVQVMVMHQEANRQKPEYDRGVWEEVPRWQDEATDYLRATPELDEPDATLFMSHVDGLDYKLKLPDRFVGEIAIVRERQRRLREMIRRFE